MDLANKDNCTGCGACVNACSFNAIKLVEDTRGFLNPLIDVTICKGCGICRKSCPEINNKRYNRTIASYAAVNKLENRLRKGSSGSVFMELASEVIYSGGIVYGCAWDGIQHVKHIKIENEEDIDKILKSKYVQSDMGLIYRNVKTNLQSGRYVLFSGTPCQVSGLKLYLGEDYENLLCIDVVCHGVPNQRVFNEYIKTLEKKEKSKITSYSFRDKVKGIGNYATTYTTNNNRRTMQWTLLSYGYLFMNNYLSRESCYNCKYAQIDRVGDITLGDFWGINKYDDSFKLDNGVSAVIINTEKGRQLFSKVENCFLLKKIPYENIYSSNPQLTRPAVKPKDRDDLWIKYGEYSYKVFDNYYKKRTVFTRIKAKIKLIIFNSSIKYYQERNDD